MKNKTIVCILALFLCAFAVFLPTNTYAYAEEGENSAESGDETMFVNAAWLDGEMLRIEVTDRLTGANSALALRLTDYISDAENSEYLSIQAVDLEGNKSGVIELKNPYYKTEKTAEKSDGMETPDGNTENPSKSTEASTAEPSEVTQSTIPASEKPFTPEGTGTVMDNAESGDGKEFFTITTEDENVFYLIVDRQRNADNVYLLNSVTEDDLIMLSKKNETADPKAEEGVSAIPTPVPEPAPQQPEQEQEQDEPAQTPASSNNIYFFAAIAVIFAGGVGYYLKIYKPKKQAGDIEYDEADDGDEADAEEEPESADDDDLLPFEYGLEGSFKPEYDRRIDE